MEHKALIMGSAMGIAMLGMAHMMLTGGVEAGGLAAAGFVLIHLGAALVLAIVAFFTVRRGGKVPPLLARLHRPRWRHVLGIMLGAGGTGFVAHLILHGGI